MVEAYLRWKYNHGVNVTPTQPPPPSSSNRLEITTIDIYTLSTSIKIAISSTGEDTTASALAEMGFVGNAPFKPSVVISIKTLELYRVLRRRKPSFSVEAFVKVISDLYLIPYRPRYRRMFADAFDVYLDIIRVVNQRVKASLSQDGPDWRVLNACPACSYELNDEPNLIFRRMYAIDGNDSLKRIARVGAREIGDTRCFLDSDYYIPTEEVDQWAREVRPGSARDENFEDSTSDNGEEQDSTNSESPDQGACANNWKAAQSDSKKHMWGVFAETGLFASACRHGFFLWVADMIRSGEQSKYPLAITARALQTLGPRLLQGYDIGCVFKKTIASSSLGPKFDESESRCCVNAFHGYSHNFTCQTKNHPNVIDGMGLEDLETMERIFSSSNQVAAVTRYASAYHRRVFIDMFLQQWDDDKYQNLASMLFNNYRQALSIIDVEGPAVEETAHALGISLSDLETWHHQQAEFFETIGEESPWDIHAVTYVELLQDLDSATSRAETSSAKFLNAVPYDYQFNLPSGDAPTPTTYSSELSRTRRLESERRYAQERQDRLLRQVLELEVQMGIAKRWTPDTPEYVETACYIHERRYHQALNHLQRLVVQRLFELHRLNLSGIGYKARTHLAKSLQTRCKTIRSATEAYNRAARALDPPRPPLDWSQVSHYSFLDEFNLLRNTRHDMTNAPWANPVVREAIKKFLRVRRAREEIDRCNVEVRRLYTSIYDEDRKFDDVLKGLINRNDSILGATREYCVRRRRVNAFLLERIRCTFELDGFTGSRTLGSRKGTHPSCVDIGKLAGCGYVIGDGNDDIDGLKDGGGEEIDEAETDQLDGLITFVSSL
ncbi:hypothetical protein BJ322DRAFT_1170390 [Thelephora terrestris]|uniref:CxC1-like cysteine cluster associated with KDZ transposases domain-containing protein n=1 Tax=Thelephora terrestris TaxID=56493 RepID=A0A9P6HN35_9AGAM|nr:hypothetical protein BJ322DRAFT_1170390 [Thelephora terrestris]